MDSVAEDYDRWFAKVQSEFCPLLLPYAGKPITYVEIGVWGGASAEWVCQHILTHRRSRGFGIDPWDAKPRLYTRVDNKPDYQRRLDAAYASATDRLKPYRRFQILRVPSAKAFIDPGVKLIDVLYVDGRHEAPYALMDFAMAWPWLKPGSLVIFDDYKPGKTKRFPHVREAVESILLTFGNLVEQVHEGQQFALKVRTKDCDDRWLADGLNESK